MRRDARAFLWDILDSAEAISNFIADASEQSYATSPLVHSAVERKFEIIGEALSQLAKLNPELAVRIPSVRQIISFRDILVHGYATVDHSRVWAIANDELPALRAVVAKLLAEFPKQVGQT